MFLSLCTNVFEPITFFNLYSVLISNIKRPSGSIKQVLILVVMFFCVGTTTGIAQSYNPYNMNLLYQGAAILQARIDANKDKVNDKVNDVFDTIDDVEIAIGGFNEAQKKELNKFYETVERTKVNYSDNDEIRELLSWLDSWKRHFRSWAKSQRRRW